MTIMQILSLIAFILVCQGIGFLGSLPNIRAIPTWYRTLNRPAWTPPNRVFAPVWTLLYLAMAIAAWRCWLVTGFSGWIWPFALQLSLNLAWSWIFFGLRKIGFALVEMAFLWASILWCVFTFKGIDNVAGMLLLPYLLWVTYAFSLNAGFWVLNLDNSQET
ncbi:tryptophan-rich sensory protein [soil metagenome]